jgi:hypothetical protein
MGRRSFVLALAVAVTGLALAAGEGFKLNALAVALFAAAGLLFLGWAVFYLRPAWRALLRRFFPPPPAERTIGFSRKDHDSDSQPGADEYVNFHTSSRAPRVFGTHGRPARLEFQEPRRVTIRGKDLNKTRIPVGSRGGYLLITKFTDHGFGVEEHGTDGDLIVLGVFYSG